MASSRRMRVGKDDWESSHNLHGVLVYILIYPRHCLVYWRSGRISGNVNERLIFLYQSPFSKIAPEICTTDYHQEKDIDEL